MKHMICKKNFLYSFLYTKKSYLCTRKNDGALAQLARAFDWQSRGHEFDSHMLHKNCLKAND